ncbi:MAG TPA: XdhC/CoxI family protein, partial [Candidatus Eisenbacteria bacterium]
MIDFQRQLLQLLESGRRVAVATIVEARGSTPQREGGRIIVAEDGATWFTIGGGAFEALVIDDAKECLRSGRSDLKSYSLHDSGDEALGMACGGNAMVFIDVPPIAPPLLIFGAGHVGRALARLAVGFGFRVSVIDDRPDMLDTAAFPAGTTLIATDRSFRENVPPIDAATSIVLVTRCHDTDEAAFEGVAHAPWSYLGMIGSRRKVKVVFDRLVERGMARDILDRIHAPIGVPIGSHLPEEVAVS